MDLYSIKFMASQIFSLSRYSILNLSPLLSLLLLSKGFNTFGGDNELCQKETAPFFPLHPEVSFCLFLPEFIIINSGASHILAAEQNMPSETVNIAAYNL